MVVAAAERRARNNNGADRNNNAQVRRSRAIWDETRKPGAPVTSLAKAILYELQPIRFSDVDYTGGWRRWKARGVAVQRASSSLALALFRFLQSLSLRGWLTLAGVVCYLYLIKYLHQMLDAGPMIIILSALVAIFTVGLGESDSETRMSAYSVFNQGFQRIMGSVDVEALVAQHVGGGLAVAAARRNDNDVADADVGGDVDALAPQQRAQRLQEGAADVPQNHNNNNHARKSGKKARRRNLELRREMQRQRQAAMAMGFEPGAEEDFGADEWAIAQALDQMDNDAAAAGAPEQGGNNR